MGTQCHLHTVPRVTMVAPAVLRLDTEEQVVLEAPGLTVATEATLMVQDFPGKRQVLYQVRVPINPAQGMLATATIKVRMLPPHSVTSPMYPSQVSPPCVSIPCVTTSRVTTPCIDPRCHLPTVSPPPVSPPHVSIPCVTSPHVTSPCVHPICHHPTVSPPRRSPTPPDTMR